MKFKHQIWALTIGGNDNGELIAERWFRGSFRPAAYRWFHAKVGSYTGEPIRYVRDTTIAGHHCASPLGNAYELR
jgi:hypothetical protein